MSSLAATAEKREVNASGLLLHESKNTGSSKSFSCSAIVIPSTDHVVFDLAAMRQALISERIEWATFCFEGFVFKKICTKKKCFFRTHTSDTLVCSCFRDSRRKKIVSTQSVRKWEPYALLLKKIKKKIRTTLKGTGHFGDLRFELTVRESRTLWRFALLCWCTAASTLGHLHASRIETRRHD